MTADAAVKGIRQNDAAGRIGIICDELHPPYNRPPLPKSLWKGDPLDGIWRKTPPDNLDMLTGRRVVGLDAAEKRAIESGGKVDAARALIADGRMRTPEDLIGLIRS